MLEYLVILIKVFHWNRFVLISAETAVEPLSMESEGAGGLIAGAKGPDFHFSFLKRRYPLGLLSLTFSFSLISASPRGLLAKLG